MKSTGVFFLAILFLPFSVRAQSGCAKTKTIYSIEKSGRRYPSDIIRDSMLRDGKNLELHIREDINGLYEITFNDSVYFSGMLSGDARIGYHPQIFLLRYRKNNNRLTLRSLEGKPTFSFLFDAAYLYISIYPQAPCTMIVKRSAKRPFRG